MIRLKRTTTKLADGTRVTRVKPNTDPLEWQIQAEAVRRLRALPGYGAEVQPGVTFTLAGDFNSARRSRQQATIAKATGIAAGEPDLRIYATNGRLLLIEMKGPKTPVSAEQKIRHPLLGWLGHQVHVVRGKTIEQGASDVVKLVKDWLGEAANDNGKQGKVA